MPENSQVGTYAALQREVLLQFQGDWVRFLRAVENPAEILEFVLASKCAGDMEALKGWFSDKGLPADWMQRFKIAQANARIEQALGAAAEPTEE